MDSPQLLVPPLPAITAGIRHLLVWRARRLEDEAAGWTNGRDAPWRVLTAAPLQGRCSFPLQVSSLGSEV